jgi:hypothetical protein
MIDDLMEMMLERLRAYKKKSGYLPERVIVYRDGVSEVSQQPFYLINLSRALTYNPGSIQHSA